MKPPTPPALRSAGTLALTLATTLILLDAVAQSPARQLPLIVTALVVTGVGLRLEAAILTRR
ncbi:hypothetical protein [Actinocorallia lasiicapitis]